ncbi:DHA1 family bicyclomycin/chloramphenicol resistance-like MFS transporter [Streptomyces sp. TLI_55]|uniref:multidrug effflux MFS transporter n=1 Tax=Streptomyces sp. TLI_55 TaxID=1938861 RepID=UPI000BD61FAC|nr:multidrug effflux MFS transporter [Streptomyces sp. TLI_55]SNX88222.1 DHA1 family bicyclomycin/chloramphenicol resistance-like MFS transporter [Streptomyces sp. TLI_55]
MSQEAEEATAGSKRYRGVLSLARRRRQAADPGASARRTGLLVTFLLSGLTAISPLSMDMYLPALPEATHALGSTAGTLQLTLTAYFVGMAVGQLVIGPMSDKWGRRGPLLTGLVAYVVASVLCALAPSAEVLVVARLLQGLAGAAGIVIARAVVRDLFDGLEMARFFSTLMLITSVAPIVAPVLGGQVLHFTNWRGVFLALASIGVVLTMLVWRRLPETLSPGRRQIGGVRGALWLMRGLFADRIFTGYMLAGGFAYGALFSYITASPFVIQEIYGASAQEYSLLFGLNSFGLMLVGQLNRRLLVGRVRLDKALGWGLAAISAGGVVLLLVTEGVIGTADTVTVSACLFVMISALGLVLPNANALALNRTPHAAGSASALLGTSGFVMGAVASAVMGAAAKDTAVPMAIVQLASAVTALGCLLALARPWRTRPAEQLRR